MASEAGNTAARIERDLGIGTGMISRWKRQMREDGFEAFPGKGNLKASDKELHQLKKDVNRLRRERDILKKAVAIFSKDPQRYSRS